MIDMKKRKDHGNNGERRKAGGKTTPKEEERVWSATGRIGKLRQKKNNLRKCLRASDIRLRCGSKKVGR
jgi:hypothetical protein